MIAKKLIFISHLKQNESCLQASFQISYRIAMNKKPHTIGEDLIKPCLCDEVSLVIGEQHEWLKLNKYHSQIQQYKVAFQTFQNRIRITTTGCLFRLPLTFIKNEKMSKRHGIRKYTCAIQNSIQFLKISLLPR